MANRMAPLEARGLSGCKNNGRPSAVTLTKKTEGTTGWNCAYVSAHHKDGQRGIIWISDWNSPSGKSAKELYQAVQQKTERLSSNHWPLTIY